MPFGIPGSEGQSSGPFLGRIQYDARVGFWKIVKRIQGPGGDWVDDESEPFKQLTCAIDFGSLEVGYIKFASPPAFVLVPMGQPYPPQPQEMVTDAQGKQRKAFQPGIRVKLAGKVFGDGDAYYFSSNAQTVLTPLENLWMAFTASPEAATGKIPLIESAGSNVREFSTKQGTTKFYAPIFTIKAWVERPAVFGERTVPPPTATQAAPAAPASPAPSPQKEAMRESMKAEAAKVEEEMPF